MDKLSKEFENWVKDNPQEASDAIKKAMDKGIPCTCEKGGLFCLRCTGETGCPKEEEA